MPLSLHGRPALQAFLRHDDRLGSRRRRAAESPTELQERLGLPPDVREALAVVEQRRCAAVPPPGADGVAGVLDPAAHSTPLGCPTCASSSRPARSTTSAG